MPHPICRMSVRLSRLLVGVGLCAAAQPPESPFRPDSGTLFLAHFDETGEPDVAGGSREAEGDAELIADGRFGVALALRARQSVRYLGSDGNFPVGQGTVEMWVRPRWDGSDGAVRILFSARGRDSNYININKLASNKFGVGVCGQEEGKDLVYVRPDVDVSEWKAGTWHHVAVCWRSDRAELWLDGALAAASSKQGLAPRMAPDSFVLGTDPCDIDELRISSVVRYGDHAWQPGDPVPLRPVTAARPMWSFCEPDGIYRRAGLSADTSPGFRMSVRNYLDDMSPDAPLGPTAEPFVRVAATPGEFEPAAFVIVATRDLRDLDVSVEGLPEYVTAVARRVVRTPMRRLYTAKADETAIVSRFLPRWEPLDIPVGELREVWLEVHVAEDAPSGEAGGEVVLRAGSGVLRAPLRVDVLPFRLVAHPTKHLGTYYRMSRRLINPPRVRRELADMRAHGVCSIVSDLPIRYYLDNGDVRHDVSAIRRGAQLVTDAGLDGTVVVGTGFIQLAHLLGHKDVGHGEAGESLDGDPRFRAAAKTAIEALLELDAEFPGLRLVPTHMDEVFNRGRLPLYTRLTKAIRQVPAAPVYVTFHTVNDTADVLRRKVDPFVDIRCNHGYSFEWWLGRGHTMAEYDAELRESGDEAWFYHNARGVHFTAEWSRIINGLYLWASPFRVHVPWTYQSYKGNPFDDTDGGARGHDFGMSFPGLTDPGDLIPTRIWEAMREGGDDLRYLATLERAIASAGDRKPRQVARAEALLDQLRSLVREAKVTDAGEPASQATTAGDQVDLDTGLVMGTGRVGSAEEAPLINALALRFSGEDWQRMRAAVAEQIAQLTGP